MIPKIYDEKKSEEKAAKPVVLRMMKLDDGFSNIAAVDERGDVVAHLIQFDGRRAVAFASAKLFLEDFGFDTTFCKWDADGRIVLESL